jgi:outer membrane protein OmpA-like peptidoglycan-associated protein/uncharacterized protein YegP (UPF0339 family)
MSDIHHSNDDYLACHHYDTSLADESGISRFEKEGKYYFCYAEHSSIVLRSEGYSSENNRENGIAAVLKNLSNESLYSKVKQADGRWVLTLKATNHHEIARSCPYQTLEEILVLLPSAREKYKETLALANVEAGKVDQENITFPKDESEQKNTEDDYMICREYEEKIHEKHPVHEDFISFKHENTGKYYFALLNKKGEIVLRSEGYPSPSARDNGIESVIKNKDQESRWSTEEKRGLHYLILKAGNHQEIGRSCPYTSEKEVLSLRKNESEPTEQGNVEDDYLICREYEEQLNSRHPEYADFIVFKHEHTGKYYFAMVNDQNDIVFRSEGYPTPAARDKGLESVRKNRDIKERISIEEKRGLYYLVLKAGNHQEIGRSCPKISESALSLLWGGGLLTAASFATAVPGKPEAAVPLSIEKDDDYLSCEAYQGHKIHDEANNLAFFEKNDLFYFVFYHEDGNVWLRSEGFINTANRDKELESVIRNKDKGHMYDHVDRAGYLLKILKDESGNEIARTCPIKVVAASVPSGTPIATTTSGSSGNFSLWWLLLPLLLLVAFLLYTKTCKKEQSETLSQTEIPSQPAQTFPDTAVNDQNTGTTPTQEVTPDCGLNWILFDFNSDKITNQASAELKEMADVLLSNPKYTGVLAAYTDAKGSDDYNQKLSLKRAEASKNILISMGISEEALEIRAESNTKPVAINTDDDSGRIFNRRVELKIIDANGKEICKSVAPEIPENLKIK